MELAHTEGMRLPHDRLRIEVREQSLTVLGLRLAGTLIAPVLTCGSANPVATIVVPWAMLKVSLPAQRFEMKCWLKLWFATLPVRGTISSLCAHAGTVSSG